jgi:16S rRNA (uracil1498-N3)-methyltransferase
MLERFYHPCAAESGRIVLGGDEARHLSRVRRIRLGEVVEIFDGKGFATVAEVVAIVGERVELVPSGPALPCRPAPLLLTLATAVPKGERFEWLVEKAVELGVRRLVPIITERSVVLPGSGKLDRLRRVVVEASKQCRGDTLMELADPQPYRTFLERANKCEVRVLAHPGGLSFDRWPPLEAAAAVVAIGPEGGFTTGEVALASEAGWVVVSLGVTLLRIETAALVACARLMAQAESRQEIVEP